MGDKITAQCPNCGLSGEVPFAVAGKTIRCKRCNLSFVVPKLGWTIVWLRNPLLRLLTVFLAPAAFVLLALRRIWIDPDDGDAEEVPDAPPGIAPRT